MILSSEYKLSHFLKRFNYVHTYLGFLCSFFLLLHDTFLLKCLIEYTNKKKLKNYQSFKK